MSRKGFWEAYESRVKTQFEEQPHLEAFLFEMKMAFAWMNQNQHAHLLESSGGMAALFAPDGSNETWSFGFFVLPLNKDDRDHFWGALINTAKEIGAKKITGPIQGTTYFPYRLVSETDGTPFFLQTQIALLGRRGFEVVKVDLLFC
ncbi:hypothetical protein N8Z47_05185 [Salibacteraceae bacterium]|nr:hypothetical protein [Salibacteraceae bacterium]